MLRPLDQIVWLVFCFLQSSNLGSGITIIFSKSGEVRKWGKEDGILLFEVTCTFSVSKVRENNIEDKVSQINLSLSNSGHSQINKEDPPTAQTIKFHSLPQIHLLNIFGIKER